MFQFTRLPLRFFTSEYPGMTRDGFPHSGILGYACQTANRGLSQSCHALLRLLDPRHPPQTLSNLTHIWAHSQIALLFLRTGFSCKRCFVSRAVPRPPPALGSPPASQRTGLPSQPTMFHYRGGERRRQAFLRRKSDFGENTEISERQNRPRAPLAHT